jgi:CheY-like chemotaxis protein
MEARKFSEEEQPKKESVIPVFKYSVDNKKVNFPEHNMENPVPNINDTNIKKILVAEDEEINYYFLKEALRSENVTIYWGKNGQEALDIFIRNPDINIVLMDIKMPVMDGYEALRHIKAIRDVPVIAQTAYAMAEEINRMMNAGFDEYLSKPINIKLLRSLIEKYINKENCIINA